MRCNRPAFLAIPAPLLRLLGGLAEELLLAASASSPRRRSRAAFVFRHANLRGALGAMLGGKARDDAGLRANMSLPPSGASQEVTPECLSFSHCDTDNVTKGQHVNPFGDLTLLSHSFHMPQ